VALWLTLGLDFFLRTLDDEPPSRLSCWGLAATAALNVLTKGLIGVVFPAAIIVLYLILTGNLKHLLRMRLLSSLAVLVVIAAPWHIAATLENPPAGQSRGFLWFYFINEQFLRYLGKRVPPDYDTVPLLVFWGLMLVWLFPWSAFVIQSLAQVPHRWREWRSGMNRRQRAMLLYVIWATVILVFFSFSTRQEYYAIPALPGLALLIGGWLQQEDESPTPHQSPENDQGDRVVIGWNALAQVTEKLLIDEVEPQEAARLSRRWILQRGCDMPRRRNDQQNREAREQPYAQQVFEISGQNQIQPDNCRRKHHADQSLGENIQGGGCRQSPARKSRRRFFVQSSQEEVKTERKPQRHQQVRND